jgi:hypothetical protein
MSLMRAQAPLLKVVVLFVLFAAVATPGLATTIHVRGASGYGPLSTYGSCLGSSNPCEGFQTAPFTLDLNGLDYQVFQFSDFTSSGDNIDVFEIGTIAGSIASPSTFFVPLVNTSLDAGVFFCNNGTNNFAVDSSLPNPNVLTGLPCTVGAPSTSNFSETILPTGIKLTFTGNFTDLTLFTEDGNLGSGSTVVSSPEPASLALLGVGLAALAGKLRRRSV